MLDDAFRQVLDRLGVSATYTPTVGSPVATTVVVIPHDERLQPFAAPARAPGWEVWLLQVDVPTQPSAGATIADGVRTYTVRAVRHGPHRAVWLADCTATPP